MKCRFRRLAKRRPTEVASNRRQRGKELPEARRFPQETRETGNSSAGKLTTPAPRTGTFPKRRKLFPRKGEPLPRQKRETRRLSAKALRGNRSARRPNGHSDTTKKVNSPSGKFTFLIVGVAGFEPTTPCSQSRCANRTALHPESASAGCLSFSKAMQR